MGNVGTTAKQDKFSEILSQLGEAVRSCEETAMRCSLIKERYFGAEPTKDSCGDQPNSPSLYSDILDKISSIKDYNADARESLLEF